MADQFQIKYYFRGDTNQQKMQQGWFEKGSFDVEEDGIIIAWYL